MSFFVDEFPSFYDLIKISIQIMQNRIKIRLKRATAIALLLCNWSMGIPVWLVEREQIYSHTSLTWERTNACACEFRHLVILLPVSNIFLFVGNKLIIGHRLNVSQTQYLSIWFRYRQMLTLACHFEVAIIDKNCPKWQIDIMLSLFRTK